VTACRLRPHFVSRSRTAEAVPSQNRTGEGARATQTGQLLSLPARFHDISSPMVEPPVLETGCL
jgi:hypothetical protein